MLSSLARILAIIHIAFLSMFALDVFEGGYGSWGTIVALFMHLIPSFILLACLTVAWKKPLAGGISFVALGIAFMLFLRTYQQLDTFLLISLPSLIIGAIFIADGIFKGE